MQFGALGLEAVFIGRTKKLVKTTAVIGTLFYNETKISGGFTTMAVINPPERKLAKRTSVHCGNFTNVLEKNCP